jgi:hypothetical protein
MTAAPLFGNPVQGIILPFGAPWHPGAGFIVTQNAVQHAAKIDPITGLHEPPAIDIGNGKLGDPVIACIGGTVAVLSVVGSANLIIETVVGGQRWRVVYAHDALPHPVKMAQAITPAQEVGHVGSTGATAGHLHLQIGYWDGSKWVWLDPWPLLAQNRPGETDMTIIPDAGFAAIVNRVTSIRAGTNYRSAPRIAADTLLGVTAAQVDGWAPFASCSGDAFNGVAVWYAGVLAVPGTGRTIIFVHASRIVSPLTVDETTPTNYPDLSGAVTVKNAAFDAILVQAQTGRSA